MTQYIKRGNTYRVTADANLIVSNSLAVGTYAVQYDEDNSEYFLVQVDNYESPGKLYGDVAKKCTRILNTFADRTASTGVLLAGEKGCGKSMLAKLLSLEGGLVGYPTLVINQAWHGELFNTFIQTIEQPAIILFDEFEKTYDKIELQNAMLTLLDGVYPTKKLFVLTTNERSGINSHMLNRPGRLFYNIEYVGLSKEFIQEYCEDKLVNKGEIQAICNYSQAFKSFNFDMLKALVEEMNRYNENVKEAAELLNIRAESYSQEFIVTFTIDGKKPFWHTGNEQTPWDVDPSKKLYFDWADTNKEFNEGEENRIVYDTTNLIDLSNGNYTFEKIYKGKKMKLVLVKKPWTPFNYNQRALAA